MSSAPTLSSFLPMFLNPVISVCRLSSSFCERRHQECNNRLVRHLCFSSACIACCVASLQNTQSHHSNNIPTYRLVCLVEERRLDAARPSCVDRLLRTASGVVGVGAGTARTRVRSPHTAWQAEFVPCKHGCSSAHTLRWLDLL
jgi:hypothetical protein